MNSKMKIREISFNKFKRFENLKITGIPETAKLVILVGPNGCGKSSVFEGMNHWYKYRGFGNVDNKDYYLRSEDVDICASGNWFDGRVEISFYDAKLDSQSSIHGSFYFRTAHRSDPDFTVTNLAKQEDPKERVRYRTLMDIDRTVSENYQRLISNTLSSMFKQNNDYKYVIELRDELIGKVRGALLNVFKDLRLVSIGDPLVNGSFYFEKGKSKNFHYKNLSAGEKSAFDLLLDLIIKSIYYKNTVYCIDEPELHIHTAWQEKLLEEMYNLIPNNSQMWLSTHSIGMLGKARELEVKHPNSICFLDFTDIDFDECVEIKPAAIDSTIWNKFLELAFGDFAKLVAPKTIVFCEGATDGKINDSFDAQVYSRIFSNEHPDVSFISIGSCSEIENKNNVSVKIVSQLLVNSKIIKVIDRDDRSDPEVEELKQRSINVLSRRHIESYLLDDEIIEKLCRKENKEEKFLDCLNVKKQAIKDSVQSRGNPEDDIKSASGEICVGLKKVLSLKRCGNKRSSFLRDTMAPLITPDTLVYKDLERDIFGS